MATVLIQNEREGDRGWVFLARVVLAEAVAADIENGPARSTVRQMGLPPRTDRPGESLHVVTLSWADYEHWCAGARSPCDVASAAVAALLESHPRHTLPERLDCSLGRRLDGPGGGAAYDETVRRLL